MARGGKRAGAGRKPGQVSEITRLKNEALSALADAVFEKVDKVESWVSVLKSTGKKCEACGRDGTDPKLMLDALKYLEDRQSGRAHQSSDHSKKDREIKVTIDYVGK